MVAITQPTSDLNHSCDKYEANDTKTFV